MKIYHPGEKSNAICQTCNTIVTTTVAIRDIPMGVAIAKDVTVGICDECGDIVSTFPQSVENITAAYLENLRAENS